MKTDARAVVGDSLDGEPPSFDLTLNQAEIDDYTVSPSEVWNVARCPSTVSGSHLHLMGRCARI